MAAMLKQPAGGSADAAAGREASSSDGAALVAMLLERRRATGEADGGTPRTDVASVRAVLGMCQGMQFPKPPGRIVEEDAGHESR